MLGLDKQLRSIRGSLKVEVAKKVELEEHIAKEQRKLKEFHKYPGPYDDAMREEITKRIDALSDELATRQESIDLLKSRLKNQITSFKVQMKCFFLFPNLKEQQTSGRSPFTVS